MYRDLKKPVPISQVIQSLDKQEFDVALRRRKVKSMINEETLKKQFESKSFQKYLQFNFVLYIPTFNLFVLRKQEILGYQRSGGQRNIKHKLLRKS